MAAFHGPRERSIFLHNVHTGETLKTVYWADGHYEPGALSRLNHVLRDHYSNQIHHMDPKLIDLLCRLQSMYGGTHPFEVFSAYRSPETNAMLAMNSEGVAAHSLHMQGMAADIRIKGVGLHSLRHSAKNLRLGGVGSYHTFVHVDVGRVRYW
ncbi:MAG TPA: DUF882 domain-containing protein [Magnetospirillaceae bacterium]|jgi:uncharacterized protein YcbK (DUF882 family)